MKIIILDDSITSRLTISAYLEDLGVLEDEMYLFGDAHQALAFAKENGADIVFSDINMPNMSGYAFAKTILELLPNLQKNFFVISGEENKNVYTKMKKLGVYHFLKKPIKVESFRHFLVYEIEKIRHRKSLEHGKDSFNKP